MARFLYLTRREQHLLLNLLNAPDTSAADLVTFVRDDPAYGAARGRGLTATVARRILEYRSELPGGRYTDPIQLLKVRGLGADTLHDFAYSVQSLAPVQKAQLFVNTERDPAAYVEFIRDDPGLGRRGRIGVNRRAVVSLLEYRMEMPGRFTTLNAALNVRYIGPDALHNLEYSFAGDPFEDEEPIVERLIEGAEPGRERAGPPSPAVARLRLAVGLRPFLAPERAELIVLGAEAVGAAVERLSSRLGAELGRDLVDRFLLALELGAVDAEARVADVVYIDQLANLRLAPPLGIADPATIPGVDVDYAWFRTGAGLVLEPAGPALVERLVDGRWVEALTVDAGIRVEPGKAGLAIRPVRTGLLGRLGGGSLLDEAWAVRITCRGGLAGALLGEPRPLSSEDEPAAIPPCWGRSNTDIWINPVPGFPPFRLDGGTGDPCHNPDRVVVFGGRPTPGSGADLEAEGPTVVIGTGPQVFIAKGGGRPWPPHRDWPWPHFDGGGRGYPVGWPGIFHQVTDTPVTVRIRGCSCIRRGEVAEYIAEPTPEGGSYLWEVDDPAIATIQGPDNEKKVKLRSRSIGKAVLKVTYSLNGQEAEASKGVAVIYQKFTPRSRPRGEIAAAPTFHPAPKVRITRGKPKFELLEVQPEHRRGKFGLEVRGTLGDALVDIDGVEIRAGLDYMRTLPRGNTTPRGYTDDLFLDERVEIYGPGRSYVRVRARNSLGIWGTDTLEVNVTIGDHWIPIIERLARERVDGRPGGSSAAQLVTIERQYREALQSALEFATVQLGYLEHVDNTVRRIPGSEKWSIAVEDEEKVGQLDVQTSSEVKSVVVQERSRGLLAPMNEPKNYFLLHEDYTRGRVTWDADGRLLHKPGEGVALSYMDPCCAHTIPGIGVEITPEPGVNLIDREEPIRLSAVGKPQQHLGVSGTYRWECVAFPPGATFRFAPETPTTASVEFFTDTPGIYTFKVGYELLGASSPWTYAEADAQIIFRIAPVVTVQRVGDYGGDRAAHRDRPYYRERTIEAQPGAELLVTGKGGGPLGQDLDLTLFCPPELSLSSTLRARAVYSDGDEALYPIAVDPAAPFSARAQIRSARVIRRLHIVGIRYGNLPRRRGDDVWIDLRVRPVAPPVLDLGPPPPPPTPPVDSFNPTVAIATGQPPHVTRPDDQEEANPRVNLILRTRDLGVATGSHAIAELGSLGAQVNLANGNQYFALPLFSTIGMGLSLSPTLVYNSKAATLSEAVERYGKLNGKDRAALDREFGAERLGRGWSASFDPHVIELVDVEGDDPLRPVPAECAEVRLEDGNRVLFRSESGGRNLVASDAETVGASPNEALGMVLVREANRGWRLEHPDGEWWTFDAEGRIEERSDGRTRLAAKLRPMRWGWTDTELSITDSAGRVTKVPRDAAGRFARIVAPNQAEFELSHQDARTRTCTLPLGIEWGFDYGAESLMTAVTPPLGSGLALVHYLGGAVESVASEVAADFWGRVARVDQGNRRLSVRYEARPADDEPQTVVCVDPEDHRWRYRYQPDRQAADTVEYATAAAPADFTTFSRYGYEAQTKLARVIEDHRGARTEYIYGYGGAGRLRPLLGAQDPGASLRNYRYDAEGLVARFTDEAHADTIYEYEKDGQRKQVTYPDVETLTADQNPLTLRQTERFTYDEYRRPKTHTSADGVTATYEYGGPGDPAGTGNPTAIERTGHVERLEYNSMGWLVGATNAFGQICRIVHDELGRAMEVTSGSLRTEYRYDALDRLGVSEDSVGRKVTTLFDDFGDASSIENGEGKTRRYLSRDRNGNPQRVQFEDGAIFEYGDYDPLGRWRRCQPPSVARTGRDGLSTPDMPEITVRHLDTLARYAPAETETSRTVQEQGPVVATRHHNARGLLVAEEIATGGVVSATVRKYDDRANPVEVARYRDGGPVGVLERRRWDSAGEEYETTIGEVTTRSYRGRDAAGLYHIQLMPRQDAQDGRAASTMTRYDDRMRPVGSFDGHGREVVRYVYDDATRTARVFIVDPIQAGETIPDLHALTLEYGTAQQLVRRRDEITGQEVDFKHDPAGRLEELRDALGTTRYAYDKLDRVTRVASPMPTTGGSPASVTGRQAAAPPRTSGTLVITTRYDGLGRLEHRGNGSLGETFAYDALGRVITVRRTGLGTEGETVEELYYDTRGDQVATWYAPGHYGVYRHDPKELRTIQTLHLPRGRRQRTVRYDVLGHLRGWEDSQAGAVSFDLRFDAAGRMVEYILRRDGAEKAKVSYDYARTRKLNDFTVEYAGGSRSTHLRYDSNLLVTGISESLLTAGEEYRIAYSPAGMQTELRRPAHTSARSLFAYHSNGGIARIRHRLGDDWKQSYQITAARAEYDPRGNPGRIAHTFLDEAGGPNVQEEFIQGEEHGFDAASRLISSTYRGIEEGMLFDAFNDNTLQEREFFFDEHGRKVLELVRVTPDTDKPDKNVFEITRLVFDSGQAPREEVREWYLVGQTAPNYRRTRYHYDDRGRRTHEVETMIRVGSAAGSWARLTEYVYGLASQPDGVRVFELHGDEKHYVSDTSFAYDPFDRLVYSSRSLYEESTFGKDDARPSLRGRFAELADFDAAALKSLRYSGGDTRFYVYAEHNLVAILDGDGAPIEEYLNGPGTNNRLAVRRGGNVLEYVLDHRGTALALLEADGEIANSFRQVGTWGEFRESRADAVSGGNWKDPTGLTQAGVRKYDPAIGQFLSPDPRGRGGIESPYVFASGNPVTTTDVSGETPLHVAVAAGMLAIWIGWETTSWGGAALTGDPTRETSPLLRIYHGAWGESFFGGPGSNHQRQRFTDPAERTWDVFVGATSILGFILPVFHGARVLGATGRLTAYGAALGADAGANIVGGAVEYVRGHTVAGPIQAMLGIVGLQWLRTGAVAVPGRLNPAAGGLADLQHHVRMINRDADKMGVLVMRSLGHRPIIAQAGNLGPIACAMSSFHMVMDTFGFAMNSAAQAALARTVRLWAAGGTHTSDLTDAYRMFIPNARYIAQGKLTLRQLARAVEHGHPVHLGVYGRIGHAVVVDAVERTWYGRIRGFIVRDPGDGGLIGSGFRDAGSLEWLLAAADAVTTAPRRIL